MLHAVFVLLFMLLAAPPAGHIPLAALDGVLVVVAWNMAEKMKIWDLARSNKADALVIAVTFLLVVFRDLTEGIIAGFALGGLVFIHRMSQSATLDVSTGDEDRASDQVVVRLSGPYLFGAAAQVGAALEQIADRPRHFVLDLGDLDYLDSSGAHSLELLARRIRRKGGEMKLRAVSPPQRRLLEKAGLKPPLVRYLADTRAYPPAAP